MPRAKRKYIVGINVMEYGTEAEAAAAYNEVCQDNAPISVSVYSGSGAEELRAVMRLEEAAPRSGCCWGVRC